MPSLAPRQARAGGDEGKPGVGTSSLRGKSSLGPGHVNVIADAGGAMLAWHRIMPPLQPLRRARSHARRRDRSLGWPAMESKQAAALALALARLPRGAEPRRPPSPPAELLPFPADSPSTRDVRRYPQLVLAWAIGPSALLPPRHVHPHRRLRPRRSPGDRPDGLSEVGLRLEDPGVRSPSRSGRFPAISVPC